LVKKKTESTWLPDREKLHGGTIWGYTVGAQSIFFTGNAAKLPEESSRALCWGLHLLSLALQSDMDWFKTLSPFLQVVHCLKLETITIT
jgi:hypothetical protein